MLAFGSFLGNLHHKKVLSMRAVCLRVFALCSCFLTIISLVRFSYGLTEPLTLSGFLNALSTIDFSFSNTYTSIVQIASVFQNNPIGGVDVIVDVARAIYNLINLPINLFRDVLITVSSVISFVFQLLGFSF